MTVGETIEFDSPAPGGETVKKSGKIIELLPNGRMRVEIKVGGETTTMLIDPNRQPKAPKAKRESKKKESSLDLFNSAMQEMRQEIEELKAKVSPPTAELGEEPLHDDITNDSIIQPVLYREDVLGPKPGYRTLQRHHVGDSRYYVQQFQQPNGSWSRPELYAGVTSVCGKVLVQEDSLDQWRCSFPSYEMAMEELNRLAARGTVMHSLFAMCMDPVTILPDFGTSEFDRLLRGLISNQDGIDVNAVFGEWKNFLCKAILGFKQFMYDHTVEPLAVEIVLGQPHQYFEDGSKPLYGYFAQIDLLCMMDVVEKGFFGEVLKSGKNKGKPKRTSREVRVLAIVDFKSGSGDYQEHDMQLLLQKPLVEAAFPHLDTANMRLFNWHPKDFRTSSLAKKAEENEEEDNESEIEEIEFGYSLLDKTNRHPKMWAIDHLRMWQKYHAKELPVKMIFQGSPNIDTRPSENVRFAKYQDFWEEKVARAISHKFADL
jgi:hypothetical protein